jgi:hypothetical protein
VDIQLHGVLIALSRNRLPRDFSKALVRPEQDAEIVGTDDVVKAIHLISTIGAMLPLGELPPVNRPGIIVFYTPKILPCQSFSITILLLIFVPPGVSFTGNFAGVQYTF